jgi:flagellar biosynthesis chaperone FliJ
MEDGTLKETLDKRVVDYFQTVEKLRSAMDEEAAQEVAQMEILTPVNPNRDQQKQLTPSQEAMMEQWRTDLQSTTSSGRTII